MSSLSQALRNEFNPPVQNARRVPAVVRKTPLSMDPSRTTLIRRQMMQEVQRRMRDLKAAIVAWLVTEDELGLKAPHQVGLKLNKEAYKFTTDDRKLDAFNAWLQTMIDGKALGVEKGTNAWTSKYITSAWRQGLERAYLQSRQGELSKSASFLEGSKAQFLKTAFGQPELMSKVQLLGSRTFTGMKGFTDAMKNDMSRILATGLSNGSGSRSIARDMVGRIDSLTRSRALTIARTEIIHAQAEGQLDGFQQLGVEEVGAEIEWSTAGDDVVCPVCAALQGEVFSIADARGMIPQHPNCRCAWIPAPITKKQAQAKAEEAKRGPRATGEDAGGGPNALPVDKWGYREGSMSSIVMKAVDSGAGTADFIAKQTGMTIAEVSGRLNRLKRNGFIEKVGGQWVPKAGGVVPPPVIVPPPILPPPLPPVQPNWPAPPIVKVIQPVPVPMGEQQVVKDIESKILAAVKDVEARMALLEKKSVTELRLEAEAVKRAEVQHEAYLKLRSMKDLTKEPSWIRSEMLDTATAAQKEEYSQAMKAWEAAVRESDSGIAASQLYELRATRLEVMVAMESEKRSSILQVLYNPEGTSQRLKVPTNIKDLTVANRVAGANKTFSKLVSPSITKDVDAYWQRKGFSNFPVNISKANKRASFSSTGGINVASTTPETTILHEFAHAIEYARTDISAKTKAFVIQRAEGAQMETLRKITKTKGYRAEEVAYRDKWVEKGGSAYSGKVYNYSPATEIITMGIERLANDPYNFFTKDRDYFNFMVGILKDLK